MLSGVLGRNRGNDRDRSDRDRDRSRPSMSNDSSSNISANNNSYSSLNPSLYPTSPGGTPMHRQDSINSSGSGSTSRRRGGQNSAASNGGGAGGGAGIYSPTSPNTPALLPEEMRALQKERQRERESAINAELSRQSTGSNSHVHSPSNSSASAAAGAGTGTNPTAPRGSSSSSSSRNPYSSNHMESSVTRLLVATKLLLEALTKWSIGQKSETEVSDIYVRLGNDFNTARMAFGSYGIDMSDLLSVPDDLRGCLERCLSEDASPAVLEQHLPRVREIIIHLLQGLKLKQAEYKRILVNNQGRTSTGSPASSRRESGANGEARNPSAPSRSSRLMRQQRQGVSEAAGGTVNTPEPLEPDANSRPEALKRAHTSERTTAESDGAGSPAATAQSGAPPEVPRHALSDQVTGRESTLAKTSSRSHAANAFSPARGSGASSKPAADASGSNADGADADPSLLALKSRDALERRASKRFSTYTFNKMGVGQGLNQNFGSGNFSMSMLNMGATGSPIVDRKAERRPGSRRNKPSISESPLEEGRLRSPSVSQQRSRPGSNDETEELATPVGRSPSNSAAANAARGLAPPAPRSPTPSNIANSSTDSLPFVDATQQPASPVRSEADDVPPVPPLPPLPTVEERARLDAIQDGAGKHSRTGSFSQHRIASATSQRTLGPSSSSRTLSASYGTGGSTPGPIQVFLQLGRQTRKAMIENQTDLSIAKLRMLFVDRFAYSPGKDDFPNIYLKDPSSGVSYELEDLTDVTNGCMLTLNIEPLDQVKQHLDLSLSAISRELREVKAALTERDARDLSFASGRLSTSMNHGAFAQSTHLAAPLASPSKFSDSQFAAAGHRVASFQRRPSGIGPTDGKSEASHESAPGAAAALAETGQTQQLPESPNSTGARVAGDLKAHYEEVLSLRREMAVLRQIHGDFSTDVGGMLKGLKEQSAKVRAIAATEVPAERNFIIAGKGRLDSSSQEVLTLVEDLQDVVDDLKLDVIQRGVKPKPATMKKIGADIARATRGLEDLEKYVQTVKPSWKKTWESELQNIVDEQEFLNHQEGLIADLRDDHTALQEVYENIQQVVKLRSAGRPAGGKYIPPLPEEGHEGLSTVMLEVRGQNIDHEKRLRALQAAEKSRQREMASRTDEFTEELAGFVQGKAGDGLRKTGGHLEAERLRAKRDKATLLAMFGAGGSGGAPVEVDVAKPKRLILGGKEGGPGPALSPGLSPGAMATPTSATSPAAGDTSLAESSAGAGGDVEEQGEAHTAEESVERKGGDGDEDPA